MKARTSSAPIARSRESPTCSTRRARRREAGHTADHASAASRSGACAGVEGAPHGLGQPGRRPQPGRHRVAGRRVHQTGRGARRGHGLHPGEGPAHGDVDVLVRQHPGWGRSTTFEADRQPPPQLVVGHRGRRGEGRLLDQDAALAQVERVEEGRPGVAIGAVRRGRRPVHQRARPGGDGWAVEAGDEAERRLVGARRTGAAQQPVPAAARRVDDQPDVDRTVRRPAAGGCPSRSAGRPTAAPTTVRPPARPNASESTACRRALSRTA